MVTIPDVVDAVQAVLTEAAAAAGRASGFVKRRSKLDGAAFAQALVFGWLANPDATLEELAQVAAALGVRISPQGLDQRFTPAAAACLERVLAAAAGAVVAAEPAAIPLLQRFNGVHVQDSTTIRLPDALAGTWPGCGGRTPGAGRASLKLQVRLELAAGALDGPHPAAGREQDKTTARRHAPLPPGALRIADLGYFSLGELCELGAAEVYWLSRYHAQTAVFDAAGRRREVPELLRAHGGVADLPIALGAARRLRCRLLAARVPPDVAATRRRKLRAAAKRDGKTPSKARLALADWTVLLTNVPPALLSVEEALVLARARWQIELLFKLWKGHGRVDESRSVRPDRVLCEVYAKLTAMVVQHWVFLTACWAWPDRSLVKAARTVRRHAAHLAAALADRNGLRAALAVIARCLEAGCRINKRRADPHTYQLLLAFPATPAPAVSNCAA